MEKQREERKQARKRKANADDESSGISDFYSEDEYDEKLNKVVRRGRGKKLTKTKETPSKDTAAASSSSSGTKEKAASGDFNVENVAPPRKKMTSKEKRAAERNQKRKKIGSNFYEVSNVKNRNRNKKKE